MHMIAELARSSGRAICVRILVGSLLPLFIMDGVYLFDDVHPGRYDQMIKLHDDLKNRYNELLF